MLSGPVLGQIIGNKYMESGLGGWFQCYKSQLSSGLAKVETFYQNVLVLSIVVILSLQPAWPLLQQQVWCLGPHSCSHSGAQLPAH